jgi:hypothetical protein
VAAHRYWRFSLTAADGGSSLAVAELELRDAASGPNLANTAVGPRTATWSLATGTNMTTATGDGNATATGYAFESTLQGVANGTASRVLTLTGAGTVSGNYTVDSEATFDLMRIFVNGVVQVTDSGAGKSGSFFLSLPTNGTVEFRYSKDGSGNVGTDKATWSGVTVGGPLLVATSSGSGGLAFDGDASTSWTVTGTLATIRYDFTAAPKDIVEHAVKAPAATLTNAPKNWSLAWSDNDIDYVAASVVAGQTGWSAGEQRVFNHATYSPAVGVVVLPAQSLRAVAVTPAAPQVRAMRTEPSLQASPMIAGIVKENGVAVSRTVRAYCRVTGELLGEAVSNVNTGAFSINARGRTDNCYVVALDDLGVAPDYNAKIYDLILPV